MCTIPSCAPAAVKCRKGRKWKREAMNWFSFPHATSGWDDARFQNKNKFEWQQHLRGENPKETYIYGKVLLLIQQAASLLQSLKGINTGCDTGMSFRLSQKGEKLPQGYIPSYAKQPEGIIRLVTFILNKSNFLLNHKNCIGLVTAVISEGSQLSLLNYESYSNVKKKPRWLWFQ